MLDNQQVELKQKSEETIEEMVRLGYPRFEAERAVWGTLVPELDWDIVHREIMTLEECKKRYGYTETHSK